MYEVKRSKGSKNILDLRNKLNKNDCKYYVYGHIKNDNIIYIGSGTLRCSKGHETDGSQRCFSNCSRQYRVDGFVDSVCIYDFFHDIREAHKVEEKLTNELKEQATWEIYNIISGENVKGVNNPFYGQKHKKETLEKMEKTIVGVGRGDIIIFNSLHAALKEGYSMGNISLCCNGTRKTHKGYNWYYYNQIFDIYFGEW